MHCSQSWCSNPKTSKTEANQSSILPGTSSNHHKKGSGGKELEGIVLHPGVNESTTVVSAWWKTLSDVSNVEVKLPHERHGLAGKASNKSKPAVKDAFLKFVDLNSHPNGRHAGSHSPQFYLRHNLQGSTPPPPKAGEKDFETKAKSSVVWVFNCAQTEVGGVRVQHLLLANG